ncbi:hypothetical protein HK102_001361, partial [Quaeritorhiza haematococci]
IYDGALFTFNHPRTLLPLLKTLHPSLNIPHVKSYIESHHSSEQKHLTIMNKLLPPPHRTRLIPFWHVAGFALGLIPLWVGGQRGLFRTIQYVETFVEGHYMEQIVFLRGVLEGAERGDNVDEVGVKEGESGVGLSEEDVEGIEVLVDVLQKCCDDEVHHKNDSIERLVEGVEGVDGREAKGKPEEKGGEGVVARVWQWIVESGSKAAVEASKVV